MSKVAFLPLFFVCALFLSGCEKPMDKPEIVDPLYQDLVREADSFTKLAEAEEKKLKSTRAQLEETEARDPFRKGLIESTYRSEKVIRELKQRALYFEVRAQQRKEFARKDYLRAFEAKEPWPRKEEFHSYELKKKLLYAPRNWDERVPKTTRYNKKSPGITGKPAEAAGGGASEAKAESKPAAH